MPERKQFVVYVSCVGEQDPISPKTNAEGSLLTCCRYLRDKGVVLHEAVLIPTSRELSPGRHTEDKAEECAQILQREGLCTEVFIKPLKVSNPADLKEVYPQMQQLLLCVFDELRRQSVNESIPKIILHINTSSGTPQMKESLIFLITTEFADLIEKYSWQTYLWQVFDPRGGYITLEERIQPAPELDLLTQQRILLRLEQLVKNHIYQEANDWLKLNLQVQYLDLAKGILSFLTDYDHWLYKSAKNRINKLLKQNHIPTSLKDWLQKVAQWLNALIDPSMNQSKIAIDRYYCAVRRHKNGFYPDVINHAWAACELLLEYHANVLRIPVSHKTSSWDLIRQVRRKNSPLNTQQIKLQGHPEKSLLDAIDWLREIRNDVIHSRRPVTQQLSEHALEIARRTIEVVGLENEAKNCPLCPDLVEEKLTWLIQAMRESLWR